MEKNIFEEILEKIQREGLVVTGDTTHSDNTADQDVQSGARKRKSFNTADTTAPPIKDFQSSGEREDDNKTGSCVHLRGGWCSVHGVQAKKTVEFWRSWEKLKSGLFGNVRRRRTVYRCEIGLKTGGKSQMTGPSASSEKGERLGDLAGVSLGVLRHGCGSDEGD